MKYALIGCGRISPNHLAAACKNNLEIVALCDLNENNMQVLVHLFELSDHINKYTDYKAMLKNEKPDLVAIATDSGKHAVIAIDCIRAGCNVIIEKPIALSLTDADAIIKAGKENHVKICACHQNRFNKAVQKIRDAIDSNRFGKLYHAAAHIRWNRGKQYYEQANWRGTWEQDGGALMNQCIHNIDLLRWMMGDEIIDVVGFTDRLSHSYLETEDLGIALVRFSNGGYGIIEGTTNVYPNNLEETLYLFGEKGTVKAGGNSVNILEEWRFKDAIEDAQEVKSKFQENPPNVYGFGHTPLYEDVIDAIQSDREPYVDAEAGKRALELVLAIYKSSLDEKIVKFPVKSCSTLDFKGRF